MSKKRRKIILSGQKYKSPDKRKKVRPQYAQSKCVNKTIGINVLEEILENVARREFGRGGGAWRRVATRVRLYALRAGTCHDTIDTIVVNRK